MIHGQFCCHAARDAARADRLEVALRFFSVVLSLCRDGRSSPKSDFNLMMMDAAALLYHTVWRREQHLSRQ